MKILTKAKLLNTLVLCEYGKGLSAIGRFKFFYTPVEIVINRIDPLYNFFYKRAFGDSLGHLI